MKKFLIISVIFFNILNPVFSENIVVDKRKSPNLTLDKAANTIPLVNIEAPNSAGLSHNIFKEYNVGKEGLILNNALYFETTKLGGIIYGNPNLQANQKQADTILTEVSGVNKTKLEGFTEIAGKQADYILANPNGIYVNGAGFINTGNITLSTGKANSLLNPEKGNIEIAGKGLDLRNINKSDLIARTARLSAPIYGGENLNIKLGLENEENKPELALDARALGSIYAGRINIISNEEGVGVKSEALIYAEKGDLVIDSKGKVYLKQIEAKKDIKVVSKELELDEKALAEENLKIKSDNIKNKGDILANNNLKLEGILDNLGRIYSENEIELIANEVNLNEKILAKKNVTIETSKLNIVDGYITESDINAKIKGEYINTSEIISKNLNIEADKIINNSILGAKENVAIKSNLENKENALIFSKNNMDLSGKTLENRGDIYSTGDLTLKYSDDIKNLTANIQAEGNARIETKTLENKGHITGSHTLKWVSGSASNINVSKLPKDFLLSIDRLLENNRRGRRFRGWDEEKRLSIAQQGISEYISHKSYLKIGGTLDIIADTILNQEADMLVNEDLNIEANNFFNTREGKEIDILLQFSRKYHYRHKRRNGSNTTRHGHIHAIKSWKDVLYSDKQTNLIVGGDINANIGILGNGERINATETISKTTPTSFDIINNSSTLIGSIDLSKYNNSNGLFYINENKDKPKFSYLIETNPRFTDKSMYLGSEYFFSRIKFNPDKDIRLLGDSYFETKLINKTVLERTGKKYLYSENVNEERKLLFDNAIQAQKDLELSLGVSLSKEQINSLKSDILWYVEEEINGEKILVPKIYLSKNSIKENGNSIKASGNININALIVENNGQIKAQKNLVINTEKFYQEALYKNSALVGENIKLTTKDKFENVGGLINAENNINIIANSIENKRNLRVRNNDHYDIVSATLGEGEISAKNIDLSANNIENYGAKIIAEKDLKLQANENISLKTVESLRRIVTGDARNYDVDEKRKNIGSELRAENIKILADAVNIKGTNIFANENIDIRAKKDINILSATDSNLYEQHRKKSKSFGGSSTSESLKYSTQNVASNIIGNNINIESGKDVAILGSNIQTGTEGEANISAQGDITQAGVKKIDYSYSKTSKSRFGGLISKSTTKESMQESAIKSATIAGSKGLVYDSKNDLVLEGVNVVSTGNIKIKGDNVVINPIETESYDKVKTVKKGFTGDFGLTGVSYSYGKDKLSMDITNKTDNPSEITSAQNIDIEASNKVNAKAVDIYAKEDINISGDKGVEFTSGTNSQETVLKQSSTRFSAGVRVNSAITDTIETVKNIDKIVDETGDAYAVLNTASNLVGAIRTGADAVNTVVSNDFKNNGDNASTGLKGVSTDPKDYLSISSGISKTKSESKTYDESVVKSSIEGKDIAIKSKDGSVILEGTDITAKNLDLKAKEDIEIKAADEEHKSSNKSSSSSLSVNATLDMTPVSITAATTGARGRGQGTSYVNSEINVEEKLKTNSENLTISGANIEADKIDIKAKDIVIKSKQDVSERKDSSFGESITVGVGPGGVTLKELSVHGSKGRGER